MRSLAVLVTLVVLAAPAVAQPSMTPPSAPPYYTYDPVAAPVPERPTIVDGKSEGVARALSIGATGVGVLGMLAAADGEDGSLFVGGLALALVGPSLGHVYAGETGHAIKMSLLRTAGFVTFMVGAISYTTVASADCAYESCVYADDDDRSNAEAAMWIGGAVVVVGTLYDFMDSARAAHRANEKERAKAKLMFAPQMISTRASGPVPAVGITGTF